MKTITAERRKKSGSGAARQIRRGGRIPGILYGGGSDTQLLQFDAAHLTGAIRQHGINRPYRLKVDDQEFYVMIQEVQQKPLVPDILHVDFKKIDINAQVEVTVPLHVDGRTEEGLAILLLHEVTVRCKPTEIPASLAVRLDGLRTGDSITAAELTLPPGVELLEDPHTPLVTVEENRELVEELAAEPTGEPAPTAS
ncbi:MAG: 50S ribosomal protein L25 [Brevibacillus sp.]|nr:50S ribosomal protein L25 [Brevibacillus sp.]